ncbi:MAG: hypothetical protein ABIT08_09780 [Bacteroidia bacterium]
MLKRKIFATLVISAFTANCFAQLSAVDYKSDDYARFKASKTYYVQTGDAKFDSEMAAAMKDLWKITPSDVLNDAAFKKKISDKSSSFIVPITIGPDSHGYHYLALFNGGEKKISNYVYDDMLAYCPINHWQNEMKHTDCSYRVRNMIESMIQAMELVQKNDIRGNSKKIVDGLQELYNAKTKNIKDRTLLFCEETLGKKLTKSDIAGIYPNKFEICDKAKIEQVIKEKSTDYYYFQPTITLNKSMFVFDPSNGEVVYFDYQMSGMSITKSNIEDLANAIKGKK